MALEIIKQYEKIHSLFRELIELTDKSFHAIKTKRMDDRYELQLEEEKKNQEMILSFKELSRMIKSKCNELKCEGEKLEFLLPHLSIEDREKIVACQKTAFHLENQLKNNINSAFHLTKAMMEVNQQEIEATIYLIGKMAPSKTNNGVLVNREL